MKTLIIMFFAISCAVYGKAQSQRLIVPPLANVISNEYGEISLPAYCIDATRVWPTYGSSLNQVYVGADNTIITMRIDNVVKNISLEDALRNKYVEIVSDEHSIKINPLNDKTEIIKLNTDGFATGEQNEVFDYADIIERMPSDKNPDPYDWEEKQLFVHKTASQKDNSIAAVRSKRIKEFTDNWIKKDGREERSRNWNVTDENDIIKIHEDKIPNPGGSGEYTFSDLIDFLHEKELEDMSYCISINPADSTLSISISGQLKGAIPIEIEFDSENKFTVTAEMEKEEWENGNQDISASFSISREFNSEESPDEEDYKDCKINLSTKICYPLEGSSISLEACGKTVSLTPEEISFEF